MKKLGKVYYPFEFNSNKVFIHPAFDEDLRSLINNSGLEPQFADALRKKLYFIEKDMHRSTETRWFEKIIKEKDLYSIKFKMVKNIRIICMFTDSPKRKIVILLCAFEEKNDKKGSKDSYDKGIEKAKKRKLDIESGFVLEGERTRC